jgi:hypothetical protein
MLVDDNGEPLGNIEIIYLDKATDQPEWALLEASGTGPARTFVPLISASEEGDTIRVPFARTLVEGVPSVPADRELSEEQEGELYRHYGVPYSRADSPSGLPAGEPEPTIQPLPAGEPEPSGEPEAPSEPDVAVGEPELAAGEPVAPAPLPAGIGVGPAPPEAVVPESTPVPASDLGSASGHAAEPASEASATSQGLTARGPLRVSDPRVGAGAAAALAVAVGIWRRKTISRQVATAVGGLGAITGTVSRRRRRLRRAKTLDRAMTATTQQSAALARLLAGAAQLPVTAAVQGGRQARVGVQATQHAVRRGGKRLRPGRRRTRRRGSLGMIVGGAAGYVLGAKAGRQRYQDITEAAKRFRQRPEVKRISERAVAKLDQLSGQAADRLQAARQSAGTGGRQSDRRRMAVAPDAPTVTPLKPTAVPPQDVVPRPGEPTVPPGEGASPAGRRPSAPPDPLP